MTSAIGATDSSTNYAGTSTTKASDGLDNKETFLKLLIAQIKNQNPLEPADGVQFLSELSQFSQLEQLMGLREDIGAIRDVLAPDSSGSTEATQD